MKTITKKTTDRSATLFGKSAADPLAREIQSNITTWPRATADLTDRLGNFAQVVKWKAKRGGKKREQIIEARNHPAVDWLLEIIIPALCDRNAQPFRLIADAIEAQASAAFPARRTAFTTWQTACELSGHAMPFNATGETNAEHELLREFGETVEPPEIIRVPVLSESDLRAEVEKRLERDLGLKKGSRKDTLNPGTFTRLLKELRITCRYSPTSGGRGRKVLHSRTRRQKPEG
jgi:hypothetical protein